MPRFLVSREKKRNQSLESLVIIQSVEGNQPFLENLVRISSRRNIDEIQRLRSNILRENSNSVVKLSFRYVDISDQELSIRLSKPYFCSVRPEGGQFHQNVSYLRGES